MTASAPTQPRMRGAKRAAGPVPAGVVGGEADRRVAGDGGSEPGKGSHEG